MIKSKKSMILYYLVIPAFGLGLLVFYITSLIISSPENQMKFIGEKQLHLIESSQEAQKYLLYADQSARLSADQAAYSLADSGGFAAGCGTYLGYALWRDNQQECYPENYVNGFKFNIKENIKNYLKQIVPGKIKDTALILEFPANLDYNIYLSGNSITGIASQEFTVNSYIASVISGRYIAKPSFTLNADFDINKFLNEFGIIISQAKELYSKCNNSDDLSSCVGENKPSLWSLNSCYNFPPEEQACLDEGKVSFFDSNLKFKSCGSCPSLIAYCGRYIDERYCNLDPCRIGCAWDGNSCKETSKVLANPDVFKFCVTGSQQVLAYNNNRLEYTPINYKFAMQFS